MRSRITSKLDEHLIHDERSNQLSNNMNFKTLFFIALLIVIFGFVWHYPKLSARYFRAKCAGQIAKKSLRESASMDWAETKAKIASIGIDMDKSIEEDDERHYRKCLAGFGIKAESLHR